MISKTHKLSLSCGSANLPFIVGPFSAVVAELLSSKTEVGLKKSLSGQVILPCTLYDLARVSSDASIAKIYEQVDFMTTDGMPLVWWFRSRLKLPVERVYGPDMLASFLKRDDVTKFMILCPNQTVLDILKEKFSSQLKKKTAELILVGDSTNSTERKRLAARIQSFSPKYVWIGVGSPNQVLLATYLRDTLKLPITYWCVGAAIPFLAGTVSQAPRWMQQNGLEWLFRLVNEPHRLWQRYLVVTPLFLFQLLFARIRNIRV